MTWVVLASLLVATPVSAPRVVLRTEALRDVERRLESELRALGFQVEVDTSAEVLTWRSLRKRARDAQAIAAIQLQQGEGELELWVSDLSTGKVLIRALPTQAASSPRVVALRVVELLRVSLREVGAPSTVDVAEAPPPPEPVLAAVSPPPSPPRWWASVGALGTLGPGGVSASGQLVLGASVRMLPWLSCGLEGWVPVLPGQVTGPEGLADLRLFGGFLGARATPWAGARVEPGASLRLGVVGAELVGTAVAPFIGRLERVAVPAGALALDARLVLSTTVALRAEFFATLAVPPIVVVFGERVAARFGQPTLGLSVQLEVGLSRPAAVEP